MPKIIKDIDENIVTISTNLFGKYGYENVDMKLIAKELDIAVGTLYNYYPNKKELYIYVLEKSWKNTIDKLNNILTETAFSEKLVKEYITVLYEEIEHRQGLGYVLLFPNNDFKDDIRLKDVKKTLISNISKIITLNPNYSKNDYDTNIRLTESLLAIIPHMRMFHPDEKEKNIEFLINLIFI